MTNPTPDAPGLPFARTIPGLIGHWRQQAATCRVEAERLGENGPAYNELLRDAAQYEQTAHQLQTIAALPSDWVAVPPHPTAKMTIAMDDAYKVGNSMVEAYSSMLKAAPSAPAEGGEDGKPDTWTKDQSDASAMYDAAAKGFHTSETNGAESRYVHVIKFRSIEDLHAYEEAWIAAMVKVRDSRD